MTDESRVASARIEASSPPVEVSQLVTQHHQLGGPSTELGGLVTDPVHHEAARHLARVPKGDDLSEAEPGLALSGRLEAVAPGLTEQLWSGSFGDRFNRTRSHGVAVREAADLGWQDMQ